MCISVLNPAMWKDPDGSHTVTGHQTGHLIEAQSSHLLPVYLQNFIPYSQKAGVDVLCGTASHLLHIYSYDERVSGPFYQCRKVMLQYASAILLIS